MEPAQLADALSRHQVTFAAGVPAIWRGLEPFLDGLDLAALRMVVSGGSALPPELSRRWQQATGVPITSSWGMTETSPLVACSRLGTAHAGFGDEDRLTVLSTPGPNVPLTELRLVGDDGAAVEHDGTSPGELQVAGPTIAAGYFGADPGGDAFTDDGWLRTGDVATIDPHGHVRIVDRTKDLVKSGGEWISSVALENEIMAHPAVREAAVVGVADQRWGERPVACVAVVPGQALDEQALRDHLSERVASWWIPDSFILVGEIPKTAPASSRRWRCGTWWRRT